MNSSFPNRWSFSYLKFTKYVINIIAEPKYKYGQQEQVTVRNHNRSTALERSELEYFGGRGEGLSNRLNSDVVCSVWYVRLYEWSLEIKHSGHSNFHEIHCTKIICFHRRSCFLLFHRTAKKAFTVNFDYCYRHGDQVCNKLCIWTDFKNYNHEPKPVCLQQTGAVYITKRYAPYYVLRRWTIVSYPGIYSQTWVHHKCVVYPQTFPPFRFVIHLAFCSANFG